MWTKPKSLKKDPVPVTVLLTNEIPNDVVSALPEKKNAVSMPQSEKSAVMEEVTSA